MSAIFHIILFSFLFAACGTELARPGQKSMGARVDYIVPQLAQGGEIVTLRGKGFDKTMTVELNGEVLSLNLKDPKTATVNLPSEIPSGLNVLGVFLKNERIAKLNIANVVTQLAKSTLPTNEVCRGVLYLNTEGVVTEGERACGQASEVLACNGDGQTLCLTTAEFPAVNKVQNLQGKVSSIDAQASFLGVQGSLSVCASAGSDCFVPRAGSTPLNLKALSVNGVTPSLLKDGTVLAGVTGSVLPKPSDCVSDGEVGCVTTPAVPALNLASVNAHQAEFLPSLTIAGTPGSLATCSDLDSGCLLPAYSAGVQKLKAIDFDSITADVILQNEVVAGITGTLVTNPANCSMDGQTACLATALYPVVKKSLADASKMHSSVHAGGVIGTLSNCVTDGGTACITSATYPSTSESVITAAKSKIRSDLTIGGIAGTLNDCSANGSNCYLPTYVAATQKLKAIDFDSIHANEIVSGNTIAGINGTMLAKPANCALDGAIGCTATATFPAMDYNAVDALKDKIHTSLTLGGVTGTLASCGSDGESSCLTSATYPSVDKTNLDNKKTFLHSTATYLGITGQMPTCSGDNGIGCQASASFPSVEASFVDSNKMKIHDTLTIAGITGTMASCAAEGSNCYLGPYNSSTQPLKSVDTVSLSASNLRSGEVLSTVTGTMVPSPSNCGADGATACVAVALYPAMDKVAVNAAKDKILLSQSMAGVTGSLAECSTDGGSDCHTNTDFPSVSQSILDSNKAKFRSGLTIGGVAGTLSDCSANGSNCYLAAYASGTQNLKAINYDDITAAVIRDGVTISDVTGNVTPKPSDCMTDGGTACVTTTDFKALNRVPFFAGRDKIVSTYSFGGVSGTLDACSASTTTACLTSGSFPALDKDRLNTDKAKVRTNLTLAGIQGTLADCSSTDSNCYLPSFALVTQPLKALSFDALTAGIIKNGTTLGGRLGEYPSSTYPLAPGDAYSDLMNGTFASQLSGSATFGWFTKDGSRQTKAGTTNLANANIKNNVEVLGFTGTIPILDPWNVRAGTSFGSGSTGKLKLDCRNEGRVATWNPEMPRRVSWAASTDTITLASHGYANGDIVRVGYQSSGSGFSDTAVYYVVNATTNTFQLSDTLGGAAKDITSDSGTNLAVVYLQTSGVLAPWKTIDNYNNNGTSPTENPWASSNYVCKGIESTAGDDNVWKDMTTGGCTSGSSECRFMDKITRLEWSKRMTPDRTNGAAAAVCENMTFDGKSDWRLPTVYEWMTAGIHNIFKAGHSYWNTRAEIANSRYWTSTRVSDFSRIYGFGAGPNVAETTTLSNGYRYVCVRDAD